MVKHFFIFILPWVLNVYGAKLKNFFIFVSLILFSWESKVDGSKFLYFYSFPIEFKSLWCKIPLFRFLNTILWDLKLYSAKKSLYSFSNNLLWVSKVYDAKFPYFYYFSRGFKSLWGKFFFFGFSNNFLWDFKL